MAIILSEGELVDVEPEVATFLDQATDPEYQGEFLIDEDGGGTFWSPFTIIAGGFKQKLQIFLPAGSFGVTTTSDLPQTADPPFPPIYPYPFSTDLLYGREHMNQLLRMVKGDRYTFQVNAILDGDPFNLSGYKLWMTVKWNVEDPDNEAIFQLTSDDDISILDAEAGTASVVIKPDKTIGLPDRNLFLPYDVQAVDQADATKVFTVVRGPLAIVPGVTTTTS